MENVKNASAKNLQMPFRNPGLAEKPDSFFNDILSSSQNQLSLSGKYVRNINSDKTGNFNKAYSFVKEDSKSKSHEHNTIKDSNTKNSDRLDKYESRASYKIKNESSLDDSEKKLHAVSDNEEAEMKTPVDQPMEVSKKKIQTADKPVLESEADNINLEDPVHTVLTEQQIKEIAVLIIDQLNKIKSGITEGEHLLSVQGEEVVDIAKGEIINILSDKSLDLKLILPKLQEYISQLANAKQNSAEDQSVSAEGIDDEILNKLFDSLIQEKGLLNNEKSSLKTEITKVSEDELPMIPGNTVKPADASGKALQNQLLLLKNDTDENLFSGDKSYIKDLIISDKKNSELLMDFSGPKTMIQGSSSVSAPQPFISRNASFLQMVSRITEEIKLSVDNHKTQMIIKLEPETLGRLTVKISSENGIMNASFYAENDKAKTMIENHMAELRNSLEKQGIQVQNLTVTVDQNQQELTRHKNIMEARSYSKNKNIAIDPFDEKEISTPINPYFTQDLFNDLI